MIDIRDLLADPEKYAANCVSRNADVDVKALVAAATERRDVMKRLEDARAERNALSKGKPTPEGIEQSKKIGLEIKELEEREAALAVREESLALRVPNLNAAGTPNNPDPDVLEIIRTVGEPTSFSFEPMDHMALGEKLNLIDVPAATRVSGSRFYYLKNDLVALQFSLILYVLKHARAEGFAPMLTPQLVNEAAMRGTGFLPAEENELYRVNPDSDNLYLIGTSEVPLVGYHRDEILDLDKKPFRRYIGYSTCFRREAGAAGKDTRGILRVHQFDKLELVSICRPEDSAAEHLKLLALEEKIIGGLGLPYHVLNIVSGDLGMPAAQKFDIEVWIPTQHKYREVTSSSNCTDYQARRLQIRYKDAEGKNQLAHTLNGTACAMTRMILAIMENYQQADGTIRVPEALREFGLLGEFIS